MIEWLERADPDSVFLDVPGATVTYGEMAALVADRPVGSAAETLRPFADVDSVVDIFAVAGRGRAVLVTPSLDTDPVVGGGEAATIVFTSGTSGSPSPVRLTRANWGAAVAASTDHLGNTADDTWLCVLPLYHVGGLSILFRSAYVGGTVRLLPGFGADLTARELHDVSIASLVPTMLARVLDSDPGPYQGLAAVLVGGGPIPDGLLERAHASGIPALPSYGMTETCAQIATLRPGSPPQRRAHLLPGVELRIEPDGRIAVRGDQVSLGYAGEPDRPRGEWLVTGDLGEIDDDGALRVLGRADGVIVSGGENIDPVAVEQVVETHPDVPAAVVVGLASEEWGMEAACAYSGEIDPEDLRRWARERLDGFMVPKRWLRVEQVPVTALGKPDRVAARGLFSSAE